MKDEIHIILDSEQIDVVLRSLRHFRIHLNEGGITGIRNDRRVQFVDNLINYFNGLISPNVERLINMYDNYSRG